MVLLRLARGVARAGDIRKLRNFGASSKFWCTPPYSVHTTYVVPYCQAVCAKGFWWRLRGCTVTRSYFPPAKISAGKEVTASTCTYTTHIHNHITSSQHCSIP